MDCFSEVAFGESTNSLEKVNDPFSRSFDRVQQLITLRFADPFWKIKQWLQVGREAQITEDMKVLNAYAMNVIEKRKKSQNEVRSGTDLISYYFQAAQEEGKKGKEKETEGEKEEEEEGDLKAADIKLKLADKELRDIVINFMIAGRDTTACGLTWLTYELSVHPEVEQQVLAEMLKVFGPDHIVEDSTRSPEYLYQKATELEYTHAVIMESLRLHPPVASDDREALNDDILPDGTKIPKGCLLNFHPYAFNRSPSIWGADADVFKPDRWLGEKKNTNAFMFPTFSAGPRLCLGKSLALLEIKILLSLLLPRYKFVFKGEKPPNYIVSIILQIQGGLPVYVYHRK